jgi:hypothetical protein
MTDPKPPRPEKPFMNEPIHIIGPREVVRSMNLDDGSEYESVSNHCRRVSGCECKGSEICHDCFEAGIRMDG